MSDERKAERDRIIMALGEAVIAEEIAALDPQVKPKGMAPYMRARQKATDDALEICWPEEPYDPV